MGLSSSKDQDYVAPFNKISSCQLQRIDAANNKLDTSPSATTTLGQLVAQSGAIVYLIRRPG